MIVSEDKIKIGISSCLLGEKVRYDGGHKLDHYLADTLGRFVQWVSVCPEVESGLPVPREAMRLAGDPENPRLITIRSKIDHTDMMKRWAGKRLKGLDREGLCGFIFKSRSPSSGFQRVKVYTENGIASKSGSGIFGKAFTDRFPLIPVEDDGRLQYPGLRENFIERVFVYCRLLTLRKEGPSIKRLVEFHTAHKLLLMAHSVEEYRRLGKLVAEAKQHNPEMLMAEYIEGLMKGLRLIATVKKNTNVLMHIMGYFKRLITAGEKEEMIGIVNKYHEGLIPLIVPITLLNHYVNKYEVAYLQKQYYLNPHPLELMLRNHV